MRNKEKTKRRKCLMHFEVYIVLKFWYGVVLARNALFREFSINEQVNELLPGDGVVKVGTVLEW